MNKNKLTATVEWEEDSIFAEYKIKYEGNEELKRALMKAVIDDVFGELKNIKDALEVINKCYEKN